jgi:septum site-determining protein MinC
MSEIVKIRGLKYGLQLLFERNASFDEVKNSILEKLTTGDKFFIRGTTVFADKNEFSEEQIEQLRRIFHQHGMLFSDKLPSFASKSVHEKSAPAPITPDLKIEPKKTTVVVNKTLRGGQEVRTESSVLVFGNVNPGAQIIAGGSIDVRGFCRGTVHAGAFGDETACIVADKLRPIQIRIADLIARPPDNIKKAVQAERASIKNGYIVFEPIMR